MIELIELCRAKPQWLALARQDRATFLSQVGPLMEKMKAGGVEVSAWGYNEIETPHRAPYDFFAVFKFPDRPSLQRYMKTFESVGWYDYFEQVNVVGRVATADEVVGQLVQL